MIQVTHEYIVQLENIKFRAEELESFLTANLGSNADWPLKLVCDDAAITKELKYRLNKFQDALARGVATRQPST